MKELAWHDLSFALRRMPKAILELLKRHPNTLFCAGGYVRSIISGAPINDVDLFASISALAKEYANEFATQGDFDGRSFILKTDNAFTVFKRVEMPVQFIHRWTYSNPTDLLASFDFTVASAGLWHDGKSWASMCHDNFYEDLAGRRLVYTSPKRNEEAGGSMLRVLKFYQQGYRIPLDSLGAVIARLVGALDMARIRCASDRYCTTTEVETAKVLTGLLREVDPNIDPNHIAHLPARSEELVGPAQEVTI